MKRRFYMSCATMVLLALSGCDNNNNIVNTDSLKATQTNTQHSRLAKEANCNEILGGLYPLTSTPVYGRVILSNWRDYFGANLTRTITNDDRMTSGGGGPDPFSMSINITSSDWVFDEHHDAAPWFEVIVKVNGNMVINETINGGMQASYYASIEVSTNDQVQFLCSFDEPMCGDNGSPKLRIEFE